MKYHLPKQVLLSANVAPHAGAWIEILGMYETGARMPSRPTRARGLKFRDEIRIELCHRRALRGRVD